MCLVLLHSYFYLFALAFYLVTFVSHIFFIGFSRLSIYALSYLTHNKHSFSLLFYFLSNFIVTHLILWIYLDKHSKSLDYLIYPVCCSSPSLFLCICTCILSCCYICFAYFLYRLFLAYLFMNILLLSNVILSLI